MFTITYITTYVNHALWSAGRQGEGGVRVEDKMALMNNNGVKRDDAVVAKKNSKKYSEWTAEEKAAYKAKRDAYWTKRNEDLVSNFSALETALVEMKASPTIMDLLKAVRRGAGADKQSGTVNRETYLTAIFGTETPAPGQSVSYLFVGVRGPNGERMNPKETMAQFVTRVGDVAYKYDANTISSMCWYIKKRGHEINNDRNAATVTYVKAPAPEAPKV